MTRFVVMEPPSHRSGADSVFVRDRFGWLAFLFPFVWLIWHRLWLATLGFVVAASAIGAAFVYAGSGYLEFALLGLGAVVALEGPSWRIAKLRRLGYAEAAIVNADSLDDAERIHAEDVVRHLPAPAGALTPAARHAARAARSLLDPIGS